jgi:hypothetical protein
MNKKIKNYYQSEKVCMAVLQTCAVRLILMRHGIFILKQFVYHLNQKEYSMYSLLNSITLNY